MRSENIKSNPYDKDFLTCHELGKIKFYRLITRRELLSSKKMQVSERIAFTIGFFFINS